MTVTINGTLYANLKGKSQWLIVKANASNTRCLLLQASVSFYKVAGNMKNPTFPGDQTVFYFARESNLVILLKPLSEAVILSVCEGSYSALYPIDYTY